MTSPGPFVAVLITLLVIGAIIQLLILTYRYRNGDLGGQGQAVDGDVGYGDRQINEFLSAEKRDEDDETADVGSSETDAIPCPQCETLNETTYTFCRQCTTKLPTA